MLISDDLPHKRFKKADEVPPDDWGKVIFLGMPTLISSVKKVPLRRNGYKRKPYVVVNSFI